MTNKVKEKEIAVEQPQKDSCRHFWVIEVANGPASYGVCKYCGKKKEFYNAFPEFNPQKKNANPFNLPKLSRVPVKEDN